MAKIIQVIDAQGLLRKNGLTANKRLGQNFLQDPSALEKIVEAAEIKTEDSVLEIGPGLGGLTRYLAVSASSVTAIELDRNLAPLLTEVLAPYSNIRIFYGDILKFSPADLVDNDDYLVIANIPYYITSAVFRHLLEAAIKPRRIVLTIQKEVAQRICSGPGKLSMLALSVQVYGEPKIMAIISAEAFYPRPKVDSAILRVDMYPEPVIPQTMLKTFFALSKAGFSQKRKNLRNSISGGMHITPNQAAELLEASGIAPTRRAETLSLDEWKKLTETRTGMA